MNFPSYLCLTKPSSSLQQKPSLDDRNMKNKSSNITIFYLNTKLAHFVGGVTRLHWPHPLPNAWLVFYSINPESLESLESCYINALTILPITFILHFLHHLKSMFHTGMRWAFWQDSLSLKNAFYHQSLFWTSFYGWLPFLMPGYWVLSVAFFLLRQH